MSSIGQSLQDRGSSSNFCVEHTGPGIYISGGQYEKISDHPLSAPYESGLQNLTFPVTRLPPSSVTSKASQRERYFPHPLSRLNPYYTTLLYSKPQTVHIIARHLRALLHVRGFFRTYRALKEYGLRKFEKIHLRRQNQKQLQLQQLSNQAISRRSSS